MCRAIVGWRRWGRERWGFGGSIAGSCRPAVGSRSPRSSTGGAGPTAAFIDLGADFSFPLWFNVKGERAAAGIFVIPRYYLNPSEIVGEDGFDLGVDSQIEIGVSFQIHDRPKLWFIKLPKWYGIGARFAEDHRSLRIYLGFPF